MSKVAITHREFERGSDVLARLSAGTQRQAMREVERVIAKSIIENVHEEGRALLAHAALTEVGALTALEQHLTLVAPLGEARYKHIVDSFTLGAATTIQRW